MKRRFRAMSASILAAAVMALGGMAEAQSTPTTGYGSANLNLDTTRARIRTCTAVSSGFVVMHTYPSTSQASSQIFTIQRENTYLSFGSNSDFVNLGLGITARADAGLGHQGFQWHEGRWIVEVLGYTENTGEKSVAKSVVSYLHSHMLPAPHDHGIIVIASTNAQSKSFHPTTIIAWQEHQSIYKLQSTASPIHVLQTVVNRTER